MRLDVRRVGALKNGETMVGNRTRVKVVKNKLSAPFREVEFDIMYGQGISKTGDLLDLAAEDGIVEKSGAWYSYKGERIGQGREAVKTYLEEHPDVLNRIETEVLAKHSIVRRGQPAAAKVEEKAEPASRKERPKAQA
jgi:recombination protein RecA